MKEFKEAYSKATDPFDTVIACTRSLPSASIADWLHENTKEGEHPLFLGTENWGSASVPAFRNALKNKEITGLFARHNIISDRDPAYKKYFTNYQKSFEKQPAVISGYAYDAVRYIRRLSKGIKIEGEIISPREILSAAKVAHDIRNPLASLQDALNYLKEYPEGVKGSKMLDLVASATKKIKNIADDLLDQHKEKSTEAVYSVHRVLDELVGEYQEAGKHPQIHFKKEYAPLAVNIYGDRIKLQRALGNIIQNSIEAMNNKGRIAITTKAGDGSTGISIRDTGCGMSQGILKKVLEGGYTDGKENGHGIGMTVVREAVQEHHGKLWADSKPGKGTCFHIQLPLPSKETEAKAEKDPSYMEVVTIDVYDGAVVVIEDSELMRETWRLKLESKVDNIIFCENYEDYQRQGISSNIAKTAIIVFHFDNHIYNGIQIARELKRDGYKYLLICSGDYWHPDLHKLAQGADVSICPKPLPKIEINNTVQASAIY